MAMIVYEQCVDGEKNETWAANMINFDRELSRELVPSQKVDITVV